MQDESLKLLHKDIEEAIEAIANMEKKLNENDLPKETIKESLSFLSKKVQKVEEVLKSQGVL